MQTAHPACHASHHLPLQASNDPAAGDSPHGLTNGIHGHEELSSSSAPAPADTRSQQLGTPALSTSPALHQQRAEGVCTALQVFLEKLQLAGQVQVSLGPEESSKGADSGQLAGPEPLPNGGGVIDGRADVHLSNGHGGHAGQPAAQTVPISVERELPGGGSLFLQLRC